MAAVLDITGESMLYDSTQYSHAIVPTLAAMGVTIPVIDRSIQVAATSGNAHISYSA